MRAHGMLRALGRARRGLEDELTSRLLVAAMLIPLVEALFGWRAHTPLDVPLAVHASILGVVLFLAFGPNAPESPAARFPRAARWLPVPLLAVVFAVLSSVRSNAFYTETALIEGMAALFAIHFTGSWLRRRARARPALTLVEPAATRAARFRGWWRGHPTHVRVGITPAVRLADALTNIVGWSILGAWTLIALAHRHVVGPLLVVAGALASVALVVLIPDAVFTSGRRVWPRVVRHAERAHPEHLVIIRGDAPPHSLHVVPHPRRRS